MFQQDVVDGLIRDLIGTCNNIWDYIDPTTLSRAEHAAIDDAIFQCDTCSWWYDISELADNQVCHGCESEVE